MGQTSSHETIPKTPATQVKPLPTPPHQSVFGLIASGQVEGVDSYLKFHNHGVLFTTFDRYTLVSYLIEIAATQLPLETAEKLLTLIIRAISENIRSLGFFLCTPSRLSSVAGANQQQLLQQWEGFVLTKNIKALDELLSYVGNTSIFVKKNRQALISSGEYVVDLGGDNREGGYKVLRQAFERVSEGNLSYLAALFSIMNQQGLDLAKIKIKVPRTEDGITKVPLLAHFLQQNHLQAAALLLQYRPELLVQLINSVHADNVTTLDADSIHFLCVFMFVKNETVCEEFNTFLITHLSAQESESSAVMLVLCFNLFMLDKFSKVVVLLPTLLVTTQRALIKMLLEHDRIKPTQVKVLIDTSSQTVPLELILALFKSEDEASTAALVLLFSLFPESTHLESIRANEFVLIEKCSQVAESASTKQKLELMTTFFDRLAPVSNKSGGASADDSGMELSQKHPF